MDKKIIAPVIVVVAVLSVISIFFIPKEIVQQYRIFVLLYPLVLIVLVLVIAGVVFSTKGKAKVLQAQRQKALIELKEAEKQFLQHKIDKSTFDSISQENNSSLIKIESELDSFKQKNMAKDEIKQVELIASDKRRILLELLQQKQLKVHELKLSEQSYLKRKIDADTFEKIASRIKKEIISVEAQIKAISESEEIEKLKVQLKEGAKEIAKQRKASATREKRELTPEEEFEEEIFEQAPKVS
jgi:hypothetical protein